METMLLSGICICCLPTVCYLSFLGLRQLKRRLSGLFRQEGLSQVLLLAAALLSFGLCLVLVCWSFLSPVPYAHREKSLVLAFLALLSGLFCLQVLQFIRLQEQPRRRAALRPAREDASGGLPRRRLEQGYAGTHSRSTAL